MPPSPIFSSDAVNKCDRSHQDHIILSTKTFSYTFPIVGTDPNGNPYIARDNRIWTDVHKISDLRALLAKSLERIETESGGFGDQAWVPVFTGIMEGLKNKVDGLGNELWGAIKSGHLPF